MLFEHHWSLENFANDLTLAFRIKLRRTHPLKLFATFTSDLLENCIMNPRYANRRLLSTSIPPWELLSAQFDQIIPPLEKKIILIYLQNTLLDHTLLIIIPIIWKYTLVALYWKTLEKKIILIYLQNTLLDHTLLIIIPIIWKYTMVALCWKTAMLKLDLSFSILKQKKPFILGKRCYISTA